MNRNKILDELNSAIEMLLFRGVTKAELYIAGSSAMILRNAKFRGTMDIDLAKAVDQDVRKIVKKYQINDNMAISTDPNLSDDLEYIKEASDLIIESGGIKVYLAWQEFVLILKGYYADREKDVQDVEAMAGKLDCEKLDKSLGLIIKSRERFGQREPFVGEFQKVLKKLKGGK